MATDPLDLTHPAVADLRRAARRRMPHFAFEYLDSATGTEAGARTNRQGLDAVRFLPAILHGALEPDLSRELLGRRHPLPFGVAPMGMAGTFRPGAEAVLAQAAAAHGIPVCQSSVAAATPEDTGALTAGLGWFQHYPVNDAGIRRDMLRRVADSGWRALVVTLDVPGESRRERQRRAAVAMPPRLTPRIVASVATRPAWALAALRHGAPRMRFPESYAPQLRGRDAFVHAGRLIRGWPDDRYLAACRDEWAGPLVAKGVQDPADVDRLLSLGVDAIWVSNHTGRQFEGGPAAIDRLPPIARAVAGRVPVLYCSGLDGGLDVLRALSLGAAFCFLGRAFGYAVGAFGRRGVDHVIHLLREDLAANLRQLGCARLDDARARLLPPHGACA